MNKQKSINQRILDEVLGNYKELLNQDSIDLFYDNNNIDYKIILSKVLPNGNKIAIIETMELYKMSQMKINALYVHLLINQMIQKLIKKRYEERLI